MEKDKQYPLYCRKSDQAGAKEEILLDLNQLGQGKAYIAVGHYRVSNDGARLAYSIDWTGYRQYEVFVMDLATKAVVPQQIGKVSDLDWGSGHDVLYYVTENDAKRSDQLHRWTLSTARHELLYTEADELYNLGVFRTRDSRYLICEAQSKVTTEARALRADDFTGQFKVLRPREENHEYHADFRDGRVCEIPALNLDDWSRRSALWQQRGQRA
jgi:oligopeptidase B